MAIALHALVADPTDASGGKFDVSAVTLAIPGDTPAHALIYVLAAERDGGSGAIPVMTGASGQTWNALATYRDATYGNMKAWWAEYNGTPGAGVTVVSGTPGDFNDFSGFMYVLAPSNGANTWAVDVTQDTASFAAPSGPPYDVTTTGQTAVAASTVTIATNLYAGYPSCTNQTSGWLSPGPTTQLRNNAAGGIVDDMTLSTRYKINTAAGATGNVTDRITVAAAGMRHIITFKEVGSPVTVQTPSMIATVVRRRP